MTQIYIIIGIIILAGTLACYIFVSQTVGKRNKERVRLKRVLDQRTGDVIQLMDAFPDHFLPKDLKVFMYRCLIDTYEQLAKLDPSDSKYTQNLQTYPQQMEELLRQTDKNKHVIIEGTAQIAEVRQHLKMMSGFLQKWQQRNNDNSKTFAHYNALIKKLSIQLTVDSYKSSALQAKETGTVSSAIHFYELAKKLLMEGQPLGVNESLKPINTALEELAITKQEEQATAAAENEANPDNAAGWDNFEEDAGWKKKRVYD